MRLTDFAPSLCVALSLAACHPLYTESGSQTSDAPAPETSAPSTGAETDAPAEELPEICAAPLSEVMDAAVLREHLASLATIAAQHDGHRAAGSGGYKASLEYVEARLKAAGYETQRVPFEYPDYVLLSPPALEQVTPSAVTYSEGEDFEVFKFSGAGDVTAPIAPVNLALDPAVPSSSGCVEEDFAGFPAGAIALIQRGDCYFRTKAANAEAAGASAVIIFNSGVDEDTQAPLSSSLGSATEIAVPVVFASFPLGAALAEQAASPEFTLRVLVDGERVSAVDENLVAEHPGGDPQDVVMLGAHLDSVPAGPGINDNGTGSATVLAIAEAMAACEPVRGVRFAWWGAEELGLWGSTRYVESLDQAARDRLAVYLNFDMVGSPNHVRFVYTSTGAPPGSAAVEELFNRFFADYDAVPAIAASLGGRSDYYAFQQAGIAIGGLFTGAGSSKTTDQAEVYGGEVDVALDPCYHLICDTHDNVDEPVLLEMARAAAYVSEQLARDPAPLVDPASARPAGVGLSAAVHGEHGDHGDHACGHPER